MIDDQVDFFDAKQKENSTKTEINFQLNQLKFLKHKLSKLKNQLKIIERNINHPKKDYDRELEEITKGLNQARENFEEKFPFTSKKMIKYLELDQPTMRKYLCWLYQDKEEPVLVTMIKNQPNLYVYKIETDRWVRFNLGRDNKMA